VCKQDHRFAGLFRLANPGALWGGANGRAALVYGGSFDRRVIRHEALHLFGAEDCYDERHPVTSPGPMCGLANYIMQYRPTQSNTANGPFLCDANIERVKGNLGNSASTLRS
jgi:hypothetical protein